MIENKKIRLTVATALTAVGLSTAGFFAAKTFDVQKIIDTTPDKPLQIEEVKDLENQSTLYREGFYITMAIGFLGGLFPLANEINELGPWISKKKKEEDQEAPEPLALLADVYNLDDYRKQRDKKPSA
jgi:hypothetical protein